MRSRPEARRPTQPAEKTPSQQLEIFLRFLSNSEGRAELILQLWADEQLRVLKLLESGSDYDIDEFAEFTAENFYRHYFTRQLPVVSEDSRQFLEERPLLGLLSQLMVQSWSKDPQTFVVASKWFSSYLLLSTELEDYEPSPDHVMAEAEFKRQFHNRFPARAYDRSSGPTVEESTFKNVQIGNLKINSDGVITYIDKSIKLSQNALTLLHLLVKNIPDGLDRDDLLRELFPTADYEASHESLKLKLKSLMQRLRRDLEFVGLPSKTIIWKHKKNILVDITVIAGAASDTQPNGDIIDTE